MSGLGSYLKSRSFRLNLLAAIVTVVVLVLAAFYSLRFYTKHGQGIAVPKLVGMSFNSAADKLEQAGLRYEVDSVFLLDKPLGVVLDQDPAWGTYVKDNRTIYLTINSGKAPNIGFPDIEFKTLKEATAILDSYGLRVGDTTYKHDVSRDVVLGASFGGNTLKTGENIPKGSRVDLVLGDGKGDEEVSVPELLNLTREEAAFALKGAQLNMGLITYDAETADTANAVVIEQDPMPADSTFKVPMGTKINITLSNHPQQP